MSSIQGSSHRRNISVASTAPSVSQTTVGTRSTPRKKPDHRVVVTTPAWARDSVSDEGAGDVSAPAPDLGRSPNGRSGNGSTLQQKLLPQSAKDASPSSSSPQHEGEGSGGTTAAGQPQTSQADETPGRFWTFTLPTKYRNRLHEHHLRMLRERGEQEGGEQRQPSRRASNIGQRRGPDEQCSSGSENSTSDDSSDAEEEGRRSPLQGLSGAIPRGIHGKDRRGPNRHRSHSHHSRQKGLGRRSDAAGLGGATTPRGAAELLGSDGSFLGWRKRQQERSHSQHQTATLSSAADEGNGRRAAQIPPEEIRVDPPKADGKQSAVDDSNDRDGPSVAAKQGPAQTEKRETRQTSAQPSASMLQVPIDPLRSLPATEMVAPIEGGVNNSSFTRHQARTPGWESPWRPQAAMWGDVEDGSADRGVGNGNGKWRRRVFKKAKTKGARGNGFAGGGAYFDEKTGRTLTRDSVNTTVLPGSWTYFLLHNPFAPLLLRIINLSFTTSTLAIAIRLYRLLSREAASDAVGSSPLFGIIISPLSLIHVGAQLFLEYKGRPIGLWQAGTKLGYQLIELVFIALWSAELALTFDNYATSSLICVNWYSPFASVTCDAGGQGLRSPVRLGAQVLQDPSLQPYLCRLQGVFIGLTFTTLVAYVLVFSVGLFRLLSRR